MSVMGFQKKSLDGVGGWGELYPNIFLDFWNLFNFAKPLNVTYLPAHRSSRSSDNHYNGTRFLPKFTSLFGENEDYL